MRTTIFLLLSLFSLTASFAQEIEMLKKGVVKVATTSVAGKRKVGTGFIVRLQTDAVYIVTASHVVEGAREINVEFFTSRTRLIPAKVTDMEGGDPQGLAVLSMAGEIPADLFVLKMNPSVPIRAGDPVTMIGFPAAGGPWAVTKGEIVGRKAKTITFSGAVDEGNSGGPLIKEGQVIGVVTEARAPFAYATPAVIAQYVLESWGVKFGDQLRSKPTRLSNSYVVQMIREKGFNHPADLSEKGLSGGVIGTFQHEYELKIFNGDTVVIDHATSLMWQQSGSSNGLQWREAEGYIDELNKERYVGFSDWRLPTVEELASLLESIGENKGLYIAPLFGATQHSCWSADEATDYYIIDEHYIARWLVDFHLGGVDMNLKSYTTYKTVLSQARAVRSSQLEIQERVKEPAPKTTPKDLGLSSQLQKTKIAFVSKRDGNPEIYVMNPDGTNPIRLTSNQMEDESPCWSPDGKKIVFASKHKDKSEGEIWVMNADGANLKRLTQLPNPVVSLSWSPNGTTIAFLYGSMITSLLGISDVGLNMMNADGTNPRRITDTPSGEFSGSWAPDGMKFAFASRRDDNTDIFTINADGSNLSRLTNTPEHDKNPSWSPDGKKIAYLVSDSEIYVMNADGANPTRLTNIPVDDEQLLCWSPDGKMIAFVSKGKIYVLNADGADLKCLTNTPAEEGSPSWSPDGTKIAFASARFGNWEIYVMNADGTNPIRITNSPADDTQPSWSPFLK